MVETGNLYRDNVSRLITWGHWFAFFNILLAMVFAVGYLPGISWPETALGISYLGISWIGHFAFLGFSTYLLTLFPLSFLITNERILRLCGALIATFSLTLLVVDTNVFHIFKFHLNKNLWPLLLEQARQPESSLLKLLIIAMPLILLAELLLSAWVWRKINKRKRKQYGRYAGWVLLSCFVATHLINSWADARLYQPITMQRANFPLSYPMTAKNFLAKHGWLDLNKYEAKAEGQRSENQAKLLYPHRPLAVTPPTEHLNLLIIAIESLRADQLNPVTMPNLDRLSAQAWRYNHHLSADNEADNALFGLFYGIPAHYRRDMGATPPLLLDELLRQEYQIGLFGALTADEELQKSIFSGLRAPMFVSGEQESQTLLHDWSIWLEKRSPDRPWFSLITLDETARYHTPREFNGPFQPELQRFNPAQRYSEEELQKLKNRYHNAAFYLDQQLAQLLQKLEQSGQLSKTVLVITGMQGAEFGDSRAHRWGSGSNFSTQQVQVPLVIVWPNAVAQQIERDTSHFDLAPTLMEKLLGVENPAADYSSGTSLVNPRQRDWILSGAQSEFAIYQAEQITLFDAHGDFELHRRRDYKEISGTPDMDALVQVMNELNRFYPRKGDK